MNPFFLGVRVAYELDDDTLVGEGAVGELGLLVARVGGVNDDAHLAAGRVAAVEGLGLGGRGTRVVE